MKSRWPVIERAKPLLGTTVHIRVGGLDQPRAHAAIDAGFAAVCAVQAAMSFHDPQSEVSRLNRMAHLGAVAVSPHTYAVLARAAAIADKSNGAFDITTAPALVARGHLPRPQGAPEPDPYASGHDIILLPGHYVRFARPLWIDLGGIAKGYAVDSAIDALRRFQPRQAVVNAGGDLRVFGPACERIGLDREDGDPAVVELADGALASSAARRNGPHIGCSEPGFVSVAAPSCADADALTKVVLALGRQAAACLSAFAAHAFTAAPHRDWQTIGA